MSGFRLTVHDFRARWQLIQTSHSPYSDAFGVEQGPNQRHCSKLGR